MKVINNTTVEKKIDYSIAYSKFFFAKVASWVKYGVPTQSANKHAQRTRVITKSERSLKACEQER